MNVTLKVLHQLESSSSIKDETAAAIENTSVKDNNFVILNLNDLGDMNALNKTFTQIEDALKVQQDKLLAKFNRNNDDSKEDTDNNNSVTLKLNSVARLHFKHRLLIDLHSILLRISRIGMTQGKKFEELENEQNEAISKLSSIVELEEQARIASEEALKMQKELELEMTEIENKRTIIANELKEAEPLMIAARLAVRKIDDRALNELISLKKPPATVSNVLTVAVWIVNSTQSNPATPRASITTDKKNNNNNSKRKSNSKTNSKQQNKNGTKNGNKKNSKHKQSNSTSSSFGIGSSGTTTVDHQRTRSNSTSFDNNNGITGHRSRLSLTQSDLQPLNEFEASCNLNDNNNNTKRRPQSAKSRSRSRSRSRSNSRKNSFGMNNAMAAAAMIANDNINKNGNGSKRNSRKLNKIDKLKSRSADKILTQSWQDTRVMLTRGNFKRSVLEFDPKMLSKKVSDRLQNEFLILEDFTIIRANQASKVLGPLVQWVQSLVGYSSIWYSLKPLAKRVNELQSKLDLKQIELVRLQNISIEAQAKVIEIRSQMLKMVGYHKIGDLYFLS